MSENSTENQTKPLVSIIIPFYNREEFLEEAIESVFKQSVNDWEMILIDDGSTDKSVEIVQTFIKKYPHKIHLLSHEKNQNKGASASRNLGIAKANGEFITFLDSDDVFFPDTLERELKAFENNPKADAVCGTLECWYSWSDEAEKWEKDFIVALVLETEKLYQPPDLLVHNLNAGGRKPGINCVMLKRDFAKNFELFEDDYRYAWEDQVFWAKVSFHGTIYVMDAVLAKYRQHPASTCAVESKSGQDIPSVNIFLDWLEAYLRKQNVENKNVWKALHSFQKTLYLETKFSKLKQLYRRMFPLHIRYKIRDKLTRVKQILSRSAHRHK
jgi:glycosyltransferase involved in cell wall biosynthesis